MMNMNELKAYIEGLLAAESDTVPRDAVVRIREMVEKLPTSTVTTTMLGGAVPASSGWVQIPGGTAGKPAIPGVTWSNHTGSVGHVLTDGAGGG